MSDEIATSTPYGQQTSQPMGFGRFPIPSPYGGTPVSQATPTQTMVTNRRRDGHDRKRAKVDDAAALESVDYWIHLDDDDFDNKLGEALKLTFQRGETTHKASQGRPVAAFNTMASTPGLGTGLYTSSNNSLFKNDGVDDSALDNALSDDEDGLDSLNLAEQLSKIDTTAPTEVPPREGLYSTPLSWEKPQPGLRSDPLLGSFSPSNPLLSDMEQKKLLAIALNTTRPPLANFGNAFGNGLGFGYGFDTLGGGFPTLGANALLETLGTNNLSEMPKPMQRPKPQPQLQAQAQAQAQAQRQQQPQTLATPSAQSQQPQIPPQDPSLTQLSQPQPVPQRTQSQQPAQTPAPPQRPQPPSRQSSQANSISLSQSQTPVPQGEMQPPSQPQSQSESAAGDLGSDTTKVELSAMEKGKDKMKSGDRAAHNDIERKYRTNLKDKISELRDAVPALKSIREEGVEEPEEDTAQQRPPKVSKGTVLTKATEYIHFWNGETRLSFESTRNYQEGFKPLNIFSMLPQGSHSRCLITAGPFLTREDFVDLPMPYSFSPSYIMTHLTFYTDCKLAGGYVFVQELYTYPLPFKMLDICAMSWRRRPLEIIAMLEGKGKGFDFACLYVFLPLLAGD
ncbi:unnamed protein product [Parascedosporium putredinis]|uniref:BHLH domain-containing protein n=1 Tax=Parascedosporium putredinis TaxID=1442378 RepID=A0A9P1H9M2_9PEZI|nr:unnamed protein product [Parascedosporium putredinis]CAI8003726.1 unnamed protein product [Parascedosporium putredinis]